MAIAIDTSTQPAGVAGTSYSYNHTCSGSDRILFVGIIGDNISDKITSVTYNGVAMTLLDKVQVPGDRWNYLYYLIAPSSGTNSVTITASSSSFIIPGSISYTGVDQISPINVNNTATGTGTTLSNSVTTTVDNTWTISTFRSVAAVTATGITYNRVFYQSGTTAGICDSNGAITTAGNTTLGQTSSSTSWAMIMAAFKPATVNNTSNFFQFL